MPDSRKLPCQRELKVELSRTENEGHWSAYEDGDEGLVPFDALKPLIDT